MINFPPKVNVVLNFNNVCELGPGKQIKPYFGLKGPILLSCKAQLVIRTNELCLHQLISFYEIKLFTGALWNNDIMTSVPRCTGKWLHFIK